MTIENGLDTPEVEELDRLLASGTLDERVTAYLSVTRSQSIGWMLHDRAVCNLLRVSTYILRKIKRAAAKLPGVTRVRYVNHKGVAYDGLLIGDHAEGEGYGIIGWYDGDTLIDGPPPAKVQPFELPLTPTNTPSPAGKPRRKRTLMNLIPGGRRPSESTEDQRVPEDRVTPGNSEKRVELAEARERHPDLAAGCAVLDGILDHRAVPLKPGHWQGNIESYVGAFTPAEGYAAVEHAAGAGQGFTPETVADAIRLLRRRAA